MRINNLEIFLEKARSATTAAGMVVTFRDPAVSELAADAGFDFTWIDMEHSPITIAFAAPDDPGVANVIDEICRRAHHAGVMVGAFAECPERWRSRRLHWAALSTDAGALFRASRQCMKSLVSDG